MKRIILHLCADIGSDSRYYQLDQSYTVVLIGRDIGVENYSPPDNVYGIIANPPCTEFSTATNFAEIKDIAHGMVLVNHCLRIINATQPVFWVMENPANGRLHELIGKPKAIYQPWQYGSPWTKKTALWGNFNMPIPIYRTWKTVPKLDLYVKPGRLKPGLDCQHKSAIDRIPDMQWARDKIKVDADIRSMCCDGFARAFYHNNK